MLTLDDYGDFCWGWTQKFLIETENKGCWEWSNPDYGGDNSIRSSVPYPEWLDKNQIEYGRDKGFHKIGDYAPDAIIIDPNNPNQ